MAKHRKKKSKTQYVVDPNINDSLGGQEPKYEGFSDGESREYHINANGNQSLPTQKYFSF